MNLPYTVLPLAQVIDVGIPNDVWVTFFVICTAIIVGIVLFYGRW